MPTNLPVPVSEDSAGATKLFFDTYGRNPLEFSANEVSAAVGFFQAAGFDDDAATLTGAVLLKQAKLEAVPVYSILDTLKKLDGVQLSVLVGEILNNNRGTSSTLGFKIANIEKQNLTRNIFA